ncbi:MAG: hypothetical protein Q4D07_04460 [Selenomonadaceae bacterium]|nr:hypothetical protein [Selenomonadaceae bacterium]
MAIQIMCGWRCFEYDSRIPDERTATRGNEQNDRGEAAAEERNAGIGGNRLSGADGGTKNGNGKRYVVGEISEFVTDKHEILKAYSMALDDYYDKYYKGLVPKAPEVGLRYSADNPGYTNNKDTHKSQDMRQVNQWAIERLCDKLVIPLTPLLVKCARHARG